MVEPRRVVRYIYIGRLSLAAAIFIAAASAWHGPDARDTLLATLALFAAIAFTSVSAWFALAYRTLVGRGFYYTQSLFDVALITTVVHITGGSLSPFAALYILATACASLLLPVGGGLLIAALGNVLYFADVIVLQGTSLGLAVILQLGVFAITALGVAYLGARLQEAGVNREALAQQLVVVKLQAEDVLKNIRSGIITDRCARPDSLRQRDGGATDRLRRGDGARREHPRRRERARAGAHRCARESRARTRACDARRGRDHSEWTHLPDWIHDHDDQLGRHAREHVGYRDFPGYLGQ